MPGFLESTRQNIRKAGQSSYVALGSSQMALPKVGYLARIHLHVTGVMNVAPGTGTVALSEKGPFTLLRRVRFVLGNGTELFNTSGFGASLVDKHSRLRYLPEDGGISAPFASQVYAAPIVTGNNDWNFHLTIPIVPNERDLTGLILLQAEGVVSNFIAEWQAAAGTTSEFPIVTTGNATATFTGRVDVYLETFTVPAMAEDQPPLDRVHQVIERVDPIFSVGENSIKLLEENTYLRIIHAVEINGALSTDAVDEMRLRYNVTDVPYQIDRAMMLYLARRNWTKDFPKGVFHWDFFDQGYPNFGGERDLVMASGLAEFESVLQIGSGVSLGSNNNLVRTIQQQLVKVSPPQAA